MAKPVDLRAIIDKYRYPDAVPAEAPKRARPAPVAAAPTKKADAAVEAFQKQNAPLPATRAEYDAQQQGITEQRRAGIERNIAAGLGAGLMGKFDPNDHGIGRGFANVVTGLTQGGYDILKGGVLDARDFVTGRDLTPTRSAQNLNDIGKGFVDVGKMVVKDPKRAFTGENLAPTLATLWGGGSAVRSSIKRGVNVKRVVKDQPVTGKPMADLPAADRVAAGALLRERGQGKPGSDFRPVETISRQAADRIAKPSSSLDRLIKDQGLKDAHASLVTRIARGEVKTTKPRTPIGHTTAALRTAGATKPGRIVKAAVRTPLPRDRQLVVPVASDRPIALGDKVSGGDLPKPQRVNSIIWRNIVPDDAEPGAKGVPTRVATFVTGHRIPVDQLRRLNDGPDILPRIPSKNPLTADIQNVVDRARQRSINATARRNAALAEGDVGYNPRSKFATRVHNLVSTDATVGRTLKTQRQIANDLALAPVVTLERHGRTTPAAAVSAATRGRVDRGSILPGKLGGQHLSAAEYKAYHVITAGLDKDPVKAIDEQIVAHEKQIAIIHRTQEDLDDALDSGDPTAINKAKRARADAGSLRGNEKQLALARAARGHAENPSPQLTKAIERGRKVAAKTADTIDLGDETKLIRLGKRSAEIRAMAEGKESPGARLKKLEDAPKESGALISQRKTVAELEESAAKLQEKVAEQKFSASEQKLIDREAADAAGGAPPASPPASAPKPPTPPPANPLRIAEDAAEKLRRERVRARAEADGRWTPPAKPTPPAPKPPAPAAPGPTDRSPVTPKPAAPAKPAETPAPLDLTNLAPLTDKQKNRRTYITRELSKLKKQLDQHIAAGEPDSKARVGGTYISKRGSDITNAWKFKIAAQEKKLAALDKRLTEERAIAFEAQRAADVKTAAAKASKEQRSYAVPATVPDKPFLVHSQGRPITVDEAHAKVQAFDALHERMIDTFHEKISKNVKLDPEAEKERIAENRVRREENRQSGDKELRDAINRGEKPNPLNEDAQLRKAREEADWHKDVQAKAVDGAQQKMVPRESKLNRDASEQELKDFLVKNPQNPLTVAHARREAEAEKLRAGIRAHDEDHLFGESATAEQARSFFGSHQPGRAEAARKEIVALEKSKAEDAGYRKVAERLGVSDVAKGQTWRDAAIRAMHNEARREAGKLPAPSRIVRSVKGPARAAPVKPKDDTSEFDIHESGQFGMGVAGEQTSLIGRADSKIPQLDTTPRAIDELGKGGKPAAEPVKPVVAEPIPGQTSLYNDSPVDLNLRASAKIRSRLVELDRAGAPDSAYRELAPDGATLKPHETWRSRAIDTAQDHEAAAGVVRIVPGREDTDVIIAKSGEGFIVRLRDTEAGEMVPTGWKFTGPDAMKQAMVKARDLTRPGTKAYEAAKAESAVTPALANDSVKAAQSALDVVRDDWTNGKASDAELKRASAALEEAKSRADATAPPAGAYEPRPPADAAAAENAAWLAKQQATGFQGASRPPFQRQRLTVPKKKSNPTAFGAGEVPVTGRPGYSYRAFDNPKDATGTDRSFASKPFGFGGAYEIEFKATSGESLGKSHPGEFRGGVDPSTVERVFYEPTAWPKDIRAARVREDLGKLRELFPNAEFVQVKLGSNPDAGRVRVTPVQRLTVPKVKKPTFDEVLKANREGRASISELAAAIPKPKRTKPAEPVEPVIGGPGNYITPTGRILHPEGHGDLRRANTALSVAREKLAALERDHQNRANARGVPATEAARQLEIKGIRKQLADEGAKVLERGGHFVPSRTRMPIPPLPNAIGKRLGAAGLSMFNRKPYAVGYTGMSERLGKQRIDTTGLVGEAARAANRWNKLGEGLEQIRNHSYATETEAGPYAVRILDGMPESVKDHLGKVAEGGANRRDFDRNDASVMTEYLRHVLPDPGKELSDGEIENVRWVNSAHLGGIKNEVPTNAGNLQTAARAVNAPVKFAAFYLTPKYAWNGIQALITNTSQQGGFVPSNLLNFTRLPDETQDLVLTAVKEGLSRSIAGSNPKSAMSWTADKWNVVTDKFQRASAFMHEARRYGYTDEGQIHHLLTSDDPKVIRERDVIIQRANRESIAYGELAAWEKSFRDGLFIYPWMRASFFYAIRFPGEHPIQTAIAMQVGQMGREHQLQAFGENYGADPRYEGKVDYGGGLTGNLISLNNFSTPVEIANAVGGLVKARSPHADDVRNMLGPALGGGVTAIAGGNRSIGTRLGDAIKETIGPTAPAIAYNRITAKPNPNTNPAKQSVSPTGPSAAWQRGLFGGPYPQRDNRVALAARNDAAARSALSPAKKIDYDYAKTVRQAQSDAKLLASINPLNNGTVPAKVTHAFDMERKLNLVYQQLKDERKNTKQVRARAMLGVLVADGKLTAQTAQAIIAKFAVADDNAVANHASRMWREAYGGVLSTWRTKVKLAKKKASSAAP